jgi:hypothetical protein
MYDRACQSQPIPVRHHMPSGAVITTWRWPVPRVPSYLPRSVVFIYPNEGAAREDKPYGGTGFLVTVQGEEPAFHVTTGPLSHYIVTAAHVALKHERCVIRLNKSEGYDPLPVTRDQWIWQAQGDLARNDLAVLPFDFPLDEYAQDTVYVGDMLEDETRVTEEVHFWNTGSSFDHRNAALGDDVVMLGRFVDHGGRDRNRVTARFGNVAMLPGEDLPTEGGYRLRAFLVEMRSRGGLSGSPVFLIKDDFKTPPFRSHDEIKDAERWGRSRHQYPRPPVLLGIDQGQFPTKLAVITDDGEALWMPNQQGIDQKVWVKERSALTIVIPSWHLVDLLRDERLSDMRKRKVKHDKEKPKATEESADQDQPPFTKEDFESSLRKATRRSVDDPDTKPER